VNAAKNAVIFIINKGVFLMPQLLSVFRAARLVGVSRATMQRKIHDEGTLTFEGKINSDDLLQLFPQTTLIHDSEYERVENIKKHAFAKRVQERLLPDVDVLAERVAELGRELAFNRAHLAQYQSIVEQITLHLSDNENSPAHKEIHGLIHWIKETLSEPPMPNDPRRDLFTHDTVLRIMAAQIKIQPSNHEFWLEGSETLLDAGIRSGLALNYGCTSGSCGLCKARVISGEVKKIQHHDYVLSEAEKNRHYVLMCSCTAVHDVVLEALEASSENDIPTQEIITKIKSIEQRNDNMLILHVQTPRIQRLRFLAGQFVTLSLNDCLSADYFIASCPCDDRNLLFHIPISADNDFAQALLNNSQKGGSVTVVGPRGHFLLNENSQRAQYYLAYGAGFAPIKSLIEHAIALDTPDDMVLFWAEEDSRHLYANNLCRSWHDALENFHYQPVIQGDIVSAFIATALQLKQPLEDADVYIAGPLAWAEKTGAQLLAAGLRSEQLTITAVESR
jgi:CDP-4-dehydro-6-deoxyglucose reductase, E3